MGWDGRGLRNFRQGYRKSIYILGFGDARETAHTGSDEISCWRRRSLSWYCPALRR